MAAPGTRRLPFTVIGGYLGAGKTTLLNALVADPGGRRLAILVNDFGSLAIDAALVRRHDGETIELASGCLCCSLAGGFGDAIARVLDRAADVDHVVIEASGVAEPDRVVGWGLTHGLARDAVVVVADAERVRDLADDRFVGDVVRRQLAAADLLVLNKLDLVAPAAHAGLRTWIERTAPGVRVIETVRSAVPACVVLGPAPGTGTPDGDTEHTRRHGRAEEPERAVPLGVDRTHADDPSPEEIDHSRLFETWTVMRADPIPRRVLEQFVAGLGDGVHRAKGFVRLAEAPSERLVFQQVGRRWTVEAAGEDEPRGAGHDVAMPAVAIVVVGRVGATSQAVIEELLESPGA